MKPTWHFWEPNVVGEFDLTWGLTENPTLTVNLTWLEAWNLKLKTQRGRWNLTWFDLKPEIWNSPLKIWSWFEVWNLKLDWRISLETRSRQVLWLPDLLINTFFVARDKVMNSRNITKPDKASAFFCTGCGREATGNDHATDVLLVYLFACFFSQYYCDMKYLL